MNLLLKYPDCIYHELFTYKDGSWFGVGCKIGNNVKIGKGCLIHPYSSIHDNVSIGNNCEINAEIYNNVIIDDNCNIKAKSIQEYCMFGQNTKVKLYWTCGPKILIGNNCNIDVNSIISVGYIRSNTVINKGLGYSIIGNQCFRPIIRKCES
jgi:UDP-3-O-[3-hydroxymyristoyl] glucosamine N-acyltransferase